MKINQFMVIPAIKDPEVLNDAIADLLKQRDFVMRENKVMQEGIIRYLKACSSHISECWVNHLMEIGDIDWHPPYDFKPKETKPTRDDVTIPKIKPATPNN